MHPQNKFFKFFALLSVLTFFLSIALARDFSQEECPIVGNISSNIFHVKGCPNYVQMLEQNKYSDNRRCFKTRKEAKESGFRIARNCRSEVYQRDGD